MTQFAPELALAAISFPLCNVNSEASKSISGSSALAPENCYLAIFVLDPFTNWDDLAPKILNAKFKGICNFPSLPDVDEEENHALQASGYSYEAEITKMKELARYGLALLVCYKSEHQLSIANGILADVDASYCRKPAAG
jgi:predicted TIM-barrel enzyme